MIELYPANFPWAKFPWQESIVHFARLLGAAHLGNMDQAKSEWTKLDALRDKLKKQGDAYQAKQVIIQVKTGEAWINFASGKKEEALNEMKLAAAMEDSTGKHPVTPGEVLPARELLADMLFAEGQYKAALESYQAVLHKSPNRFNSLFGTGKTAEKLGDTKMAGFYYLQLLASTDIDSKRPEFAAVQTFLAAHK
jgi:tetratricopeptide (TPR) repeat protein